MKDKKMQKIIFPLFATTASIIVPSAILSFDRGSETVVVNNSFNPDKIIYENAENNDREEYTNVKNIPFGYGRSKDKIMKVSDALKTVKFTKAPDAEDWNKPEQTWEMIYESGTLSEDVYKHGTFWQNEYTFGQRTYGFAISNDLEIVPGTISIKLEYMGVEDDSHIIQNEDDRRRILGYRISGQNPDNKGENLENKVGAYIRITDSNGHFDNSADQKFGLWPVKTADGTKPIDQIENFWVKDFKFNVTNGSQRIGNWMHNWNNPDDKNNTIPLAINVIPEYENLGSNRPAIDAMEFITTDSQFWGNEKNPAFSPKDIDDMFSMTQIPDFFESKGYNRYFGLGLNTDKFIKNLTTSDSPYIPFAKNVGSVFMFHYFSGLDKNRYDTWYSKNLRPIPLVTVKFKTRKKMNYSLIDYSSEFGPQPINSFLDKTASQKNYASFVSGLFRSDKDTQFAFDKIASDAKDYDDFRKKYLYPTSVGDSANQYIGVYTSFAKRTQYRNIDINIQEQIDDIDKSRNQYPKISGFNVMKDNQKIDFIKLDWDDFKNTDSFIKNGYKTIIKDFKLDTSKINDFDGIKLIPLIVGKEDSFKYSAISHQFEIKDGKLTGIVEYKLSDEYKKKIDLLDKLNNLSRLNELLFNNEQLLPNQLSAIKQAVISDFNKKRFGNETTNPVDNSTIYSNFWTDLINNISKINYFKNKINLINTNITDTKNYRLSSNKSQIDEKLNEISKINKMNIDDFSLFVIEGGEVQLPDEYKELSKISLDSLIDDFNNLKAKMNGNNIYDTFVSSLEKKISTFEETNKLYFLAKTLNNDADKVKTIFDLTELKETAEKLKSYLDTKVTSETLNDFLNNVTNYLTKYHNIKIIESFISQQSSEDTSSNKYKMLYKWFNSAGAKQELESFKEELKSDTNVSDSNVYEKIVSKYNTYNKISQKLDSILKSNDFNYWNMFEQYVKEYLPSDVINSSVLNELINPLKLAVANINDYDNLVVLSDTGFADVIFGYIFNDWLIKNDKYSVPTANAYSKKEGAEKLKAILFEICEFLKQNAQPDTLSQKLLANNKNYLEAILKAKILLKDTKTLATQLSNLTNKNTIKNTSEIEELLNKNLQFDILKQAAAGLREKINDNQTFSNIKNSEYKNQIISEIEKTITYYSLNEQRITQDQGDAFYKTNESVKSDWNSFGDFYSLNNLSKDNYTKEFKDLKEATNANVDQFYKTKLDELQALNSKIGSLVEAINATDLNGEAKEALNNLAQQADSIQAVEVIESKFNTVIKAYKDLDTATKAADNVKTQAQNNYKFASNDTKTVFDSLSGSLSEKKTTINQTKVTKAADLDKVVSALNQLAREIKTNQDALDGEKELKDLQDKITIKALPSYTEDQILGLKDALAKTADLDGAKAKANEYSEFNSEIVAAKELVAKFDEITNENKYINATNETKTPYNASAKMLKEFAQGYQAKIDEYKLTNPESWTNNLPLMKSVLNGIIKKYKLDLSSLDGIKALQDVKKAKNDLIEQFNNISDTLKNTFKEKINSETTIDLVDAKFNELKDVDTSYGTTISPLNNLQNLVKGDKFEALNGESEYNTIRESLAEIEKNFEVEKGNADINKNAVDGILDKINSNKQIIETKYQEFLKYREQEAVKAQELDSLTEAQKLAIKNSFNKAKNKAQVNTVLENATKLNTSMKSLRDAYTKATETKNTPKYLNATKESKTAFDNQMNDHNANPDTLTVTDAGSINQATQAWNTLTANLDGDTILAEAQKDALETIQKLTNIDKTAKDTANDIVNKAKTVEAVKDIATKEAALDSTLGSANDALTAAKALKETPQYKEATDTKQETFDNALKTLKELVNTAKAQTDVEKVASNTIDLQSKTNELATAQLALDGNNKLENAKATSKAVIEALENIDTLVKKHFEDQLKDKTSIKDINSVVEQAKSTNAAVKELIQKVKKAEELIKTPDYKLVPEAKKQDLNTALSAAKNLLTSNDTKLSQPSEVTDINKARENLSQALIQASGQADEILKAQKEAKDQIDNLTNLTGQQKEALKREVSSAVTNEDINSAVAKAQELDAVTKTLKDVIKSADKLDKNSNNYKYADENKQNAFNNGLNYSKIELAKGLADKNKEQIQQLSDQLTTAQGALNGEAKLANAKQAAKDKVQTLDELSEQQKEVINAAIDKASSPEAGNDIANKASDLAQAIATAKQAQQAGQEVKGTPKYTESSDTTKNPFNEATSKLDTDITTATTSTDLDTVNKLDNLVKALKEDTTNTNDLNANLDGQTLLERAKAEANGVITSASQLSSQVTEGFKQNVKDATTIAAVNKIKDDVQVVQEAAKALVENLNKVNAALQTAGNSLDHSITQEIQEAKDGANKFLIDNKLKQDANISEVNKANAKLVEVLNKIKASADTLKEAQSAAIIEINTLPNLSKTQKQALINEVKAAGKQKAVNTALTKAKELDKLIGELRNDLDLLPTAKEQDNYKLATVDKQNEFNKVVSDVENIKNQAAATLDKAAVEALNKKINGVKDSLNGESNKQEAMSAIDALNNLSSNQKAAAKETLNQTENKAQLDAKVKSAKDLDTAKANLVKENESLDALINQFTKPNNSSQAILSGFESQVNTINANKQTLEDAKTKANDALNATTLNAEQVAQALTTIAQAKKQAANAIDTIVANNNSIISVANIENFINDTNKQNANEFVTKALDKKTNLYEGIVNARQVQHLAALDQLAKFKDNLAQDLKNSNAFALTLNGAQEELQASNTEVSDDKILAKITHQLNKDKLAKAYDAISKANINDSLPENLKQEIEAQKAKALELLKYANTDVTTPRATYDAQADKLNLLLAKNDLASVIVKAQAAEKSSQLDAAIKQAQDALNNSTFDQNSIKAASDKLANEIDKAKLYVSINQAKDFVKELQEGNKQHHSALRDRIVNTLSNDDITAATAAANKQDTQAGYNTAAAALDNAVANAKKTIENVFKALEELRDKIAVMPQDQISAQLKEQLAQAQTINKDSGVVAIENALESLQHRYATNELDKAIAAAPTINDKYATLVPSVVEQSQAVSNNPQASTQEIASQLAKQLLNNAKGNALNTLAGLNNLNNAQASALANVIAQAQDANQVAQDLKQAQDLDKAIATLKDIYTKVDEAYKAGTNLPYEAFFIPADKLKFAKDTIAKVGKVTFEAGQVYLDNLPAQIEQLNSDLNTALDLLGQGKGQAKAMEEEFTKLNTKANTLENNLQVNANKLYNSPKAIQNQIKDLQTKIKDLSDKYFNNHAAYMEEGNAKMKQLVNQLSNLNDQVEQFSPKVFMNNNSRITQAQNLINNNSEYTSDIVAKDNLTKFNNATTFAQADKLLNEQVALNNKVKENVQQIVANLTNTLVTKQEHAENATLLGEIVLTAKPEVIAQVSKMISYVQTLSALDKSLNAALNSEKADKKFKKQIAAISTSLSLMPQETFEGYKELNEAISQASKNIKNHANGIEELINALDTRDNEKLSKAIQLLDKSDNKNAKLAKLIQDSNYIDILNHADNKAIDKDDLATVETIKNSSEYQMASPAIQDLLNQDLNGKKPWVWWLIAVAISAITWLSGMLAILLKRK
ncbi:hypothetical protein ACNQ2A_00945 [Mycoplasma sp. 1458C]|uniref:hypothetical protein n=1 Tax=Mycoplasma sp. 1458C TaxID=3401661 RepID=UPI003AB0883D